MSIVADDAARYTALRAVAWDVAEAHYKGVGLDAPMGNLRAALEDINYFVREGWGQDERQAVGALPGLE